MVRAPAHFDARERPDTKASPGLPRRAGLLLCGCSAIERALASRTRNLVLVIAGMTRPSTSYFAGRKKDVDGRHKAGHDGAGIRERENSILYLGKIRHRTGGGADFIEQLQAIFAHFWIVVVDHHLVEERIHRRTQL